MKPYDREKILRLAKQGKLSILVPAVIGGNVSEDDFRSNDGYALQDLDDLTITLVVTENKRYIFIGNKE